MARVRLPAPARVPAVLRRRGHQRAGAINHFLGWAGREGEQVRAEARLPRLPKQLVDVLSREEVQAMEDAAQTERDKTIVRTLADTGIRVGELVALRPPDLQVQGRTQYLKVRGKGSRERLVPVPPGLYRRLRRYADRSRPDDTNSDRLFLALRRSPLGTFDALTTSGVSRLLPALAVTAGGQEAGAPALAAALVRDADADPRHEPAHAGADPWALLAGHDQNVYAHLTPADSYDALLKILERDWTCDTPSRILPVGRTPCNQQSLSSKLSFGQW